MNQDPESSSDSPELEEAIFLVTREFERRWHENRDYRIEDIEPDIPAIIEPTGVSPHHPAVTKAIRAELIRVEMELRSRFANESINLYEYKLRFQGDDSIVDAAWDWLRSRDQSSTVEGGTDGPDGPGDIDDDEIEIDAGGMRDDVREHDATGADAIPGQLGPYREITFLAEGGFGLVFRAVDSRNSRIVALKFPRKDRLSDDEAFGMFRQEAEQAMTLEHPGIVSTYAIEDIDGFFFIVQQLIEGTDLKKTRCEARTHKDIAELLAEIADSLAYAHQQQIVHRDLKQSNILLDEDGRTYIADFGLSIHRSALVDTPHQICGTIPYMSPEQARGEIAFMDLRSDIWSLGIILYELLAGGERPFRGRNRQILDQIQNSQPWPLRSIDPTISVELQEICFKCLCKSVDRRYVTADELARDLRECVKPPSPPEGDGTFVPRGLKPYTAEDSDFFLELLPGPRNREGVPASIRFWTSRICEPVLPENRISVGVLYGLSGSGKSSFVQAGLIPQVESHVNTVYVEATQADTEVRLIQALRKKISDRIPEELSLPEILTGLAAGRWQRTPRKILIVLDQFEQRLSKADDFRQSQLAEALRGCDGETVQCLLLVRDDFMMGMTRFLDALAMDFREGHNAQAIDLFDRDHAKKILVKLGHAYQRLPSDRLGKLTDQQREFVDEAVEQLAEDQYVICVRLTVFAEMFRTRPWTVAELNSVGGVEGVGRKYLEQNFGEKSTVPRYRELREPIRKVLEALLPEYGTDIRGAMKSEEELLAASGLADQPEQFEAVINIVHDELKLITATEPSSDMIRRNGDLQGVKGWYQLTHDYLVRSIRDWINAELPRTRAGRAKLRLQELASQVAPGQPPPYLPTNWEWLSWQWLLRNQQLTRSETSVMQSARKQFVVSTSRVSAIVLLATVLIAAWIIRDQRQTIARNLVNNWMGLEYRKIPALVPKMTEYASRVVPLLQIQVEGATQARRRAILGLVPFESGNTDEVIGNLVRPDCPPTELAASLHVLQTYSGQDLTGPLLEVFGAEAPNPRTPFRAATALAVIGHHDADMWQTEAASVGTALAREPVATQDAWINLLRPVGPSLLPQFKSMLTRTENSVTAKALAKAVFEYSAPAECDPFFAELVCDANDAQFDAVLSTYEGAGKPDRLGQALIDLNFESQQERKIASRAVARLRLGDDDEYVRYLGSHDAPGIRSHAVVLSTPDRIDFITIKSIYESMSRQNPVLRQGLLMSLAERAKTPMGARSQDMDWIQQTVEDVCLRDEDAGCFAAAELLGRRMNRQDLDALRERRGLGQNKGGVFINSQGMAFAILPRADGSEITRKVAMAMTELSESEFVRCPKYAGTFAEPGNRPLNVRDPQWFDEYCAWLAEMDRQQGINVTYRLINEQDWLIARDCHDEFPAYLGNDLLLVEYFAWLATPNGEFGDVGTLLPNRYGIFDLFGNVFEMSRIAESPDRRYMAYGQSTSDRPKDIVGNSTNPGQKSIRHGYYPLSDGEFKGNWPLGFRLVVELD